METRFKNKSQIIDIGITAVSVVLSVGTMLYGISQFGLGEASSRFSAPRYPLSPLSVSSSPCMSSDVMVTSYTLAAVALTV